MTSSNVGDGQRTLLAGGYTNEVWKVRRGRSTLIEKRYSGAPPEPNPMYPNLPDHEATVLAHLVGTGIAPELRSYTPAVPGESGAVVVYDYVAGTQWVRGVADVARLLHRVHALEPPPLRSLHQDAASALARAGEVIADVPADDVPLGAARRRLLELRPAMPAPEPVRRPSLVHTDCGPGNLVRSRDGLVLIDWQCPGLGDPVEDVACFLSPAMMVLYAAPPHSRVVRERFLDAYPDSVVVERYRAVGSAWHHRIAAYCLWRSHRLRTSLPDVSARYARALDAELELLSAW
ncbi:MAG: phosphotransferase family protein [Ilumatobacteraceae bacterium]